MFFRKKLRDEPADESFRPAAPLREGRPRIVDVIDEEPGGGAIPAFDSRFVRLFPGFEHEDFEVGLYTAAPALVMRWKDGGDWFEVPSMFDRAVLAAMEKRNSVSDLRRLVESFGYELGES